MHRTIATLGLLALLACGSSSSPPVAPADPPAGVEPEPQVIRPKRIEVRDIVQPVRIEKMEPESVENADPDGVESGEEGGFNPTPPPPPPPPPQNIPPTLLEELRIAGNKYIFPDDVTKAEIQSSGKEKLVGSFKMCLDANGSVLVVNQLKSTGFAAYDAKILREMRGWKYRPYLVNGKAVAVCTAATFIYSTR